MHSPPVVPMDEPSSGEHITHTARTAVYTPPNLKEREEPLKDGASVASGARQGGIMQQNGSCLLTGKQGTANRSPSPGPVEPEGIELKKTGSNACLGQYHLDAESRRLVQPYIGKNTRP